MSTARSYSLSELVEATGFDRRTIVYYIQSGLLPKVGRRGPHTRYPDECLTRLLFIRGVRNLQSQGQLLTATLAEMRLALGARDAAAIRQLLDQGLPVDEVTALFATEAVAPTPSPQPRAVPQPVRPVPAVSGPAGERRSYGLADAGIRRRPGQDRPTEPAQPEIHHEETHPGLPALDVAAYEASLAAGNAPGGPSTPAPTGVSSPVRMASAENGSADHDLGELLRELEVRPTLNARRTAPGAPEQWTEIPITSRVYLSVRGLAEEDAPLAEAVGRLLKRVLRGRPAQGAA
ncbi:MAG: MerR family transcriptional regulator [Gammaproteobacteria bacterium]